VTRPLARTAFWVGIVVSICVVHVLRPEGAIGELTYVALTGGAAVAALVGAMRRSGPRRFAWMCVAVGVALSAIGDGIYYVLEFIQGHFSDLSVGDAFWITSYCAMSIGLSSLVVSGRGRRRIDIDGLLDIGSFAVLAVIVVTELDVVRDIINDSSYSLLERATWTAYPVLDAALLGVAAQAFFSRRMRNRSGALLSLGIALWLISDFASLLLDDKTVSTKWLDLGWMIGAVSVALSAWPSAAITPADAEDLPVRRVTGARIAITLLPLLVPGVIEIWTFARGRDSNPLPLFAATLLLVALAFVRSTRLVKARNRQEEALERKTWFYSALAENSSDAVIVVGGDDTILNDAPNLAAMLGRPGTATTGLDVIGFLQMHDPEVARATLDRWRLTTGVVADDEVCAITADGSPRWFGVRAANLMDDPIVGGIVINLRDITDRKRAEQELTHNALHDSLTGLANRALFNDRLSRALERTARTGLDVAVVYLDLDGFKTINDSRGHEAGDQVLREVATRLTSVVRSIDTVSRHGGDEFAILIEESPNAAHEAQLVAERVQRSLKTALGFDDQAIVLSASIGISIGDASCTASSMMRDADLAMYNAKSTGKAKWVMCEPALRAEAIHRLELESDLRLALAKRQFRLLYQPVVELSSNAIVGFEALLRWDHPTLGLVLPESFVPIAESNGTIVEIGKWVLEEACRTGAEWRSSMPESALTMAVNISVCQIATPEIVAHVARALATWGFPAESLILEMTESVLVQDPETAARRLQELRALGVRLAIDDFGTGYSSLSYLRQFPIDILKIDKSFVQTITDLSPDPAIVRGLLDLAKTLGIATVAEGIEIDVQLDSLRGQQCDFGQGYLFAKPLERTSAAALVADHLARVPVMEGSR